MGEREPKVVPYRKTMADGTKDTPERFFDVGSTKEHAVTFAAAWQRRGLKPVFGVFFLFTACYDQVLHDVCAQNLAVVFFCRRP